MNISRYWMGQTDKLSAINLILQEGIESHQILFVGDDIPDLNVIENVGLFVAVRNAHRILKNKAHQSIGTMISKVILDHLKTLNFQK